MYALVSNCLMCFPFKYADMYLCDGENFENEVISMNMNNFIPLNRKLPL